jgi:hypothetical protein
VKQSRTTSLRETSLREGDDLFDTVGHNHIRLSNWTASLLDQNTVFLGQDAISCYGNEIVNGKTLTKVALSNKAFLVPVL